MNKTNFNQSPKNIKKKPEKKEEFIKTPDDLLKAYWKTIEKE